MKNIKFLILLLAVTVVTVSCETYDDYDTDRKPVVGFTVKNKNISNITSGGTKSTTVEVFASDVSSQDREFSVTDQPIDDGRLPAVRENYEYDSTVLIPANERSGLVTVTGKNVSLTSERTFFKLSIASDPNVVAGGEVVIGLTGR